MTLRKFWAWLVMVNVGIAMYSALTRRWTDLVLNMLTAVFCFAMYLDA